MTDLRDALAAAFERFDKTEWTYWNAADETLADPAFRAALTESIAEAWHEWDEDRFMDSPLHGDCRHAEEAPAIVARMVGDER